MTSMAMGGDSHGLTLKLLNKRRDFPDTSNAPYVKADVMQARSLPPYNGLMSEGRTTLDICREVEALVDAWCDRREFGALRQVLAGWPLAGGLTEDWGMLASALHSLAGMRSLPEIERQAAKRLYVEIDYMIRNH